MFKNTAKPVTSDNNQYGYDFVSKYMFIWSRLFQSIISQAGTYLLTKKFHKGHCSIYKTEGGCRIDGMGDLVLGRDFCYFDHCHSGFDKKQKVMASFITHVVLNWDPMDPIESMLKLASDYIKVDCSELRSAIEASSNGGVFGGNALANFFDWNPFDAAPIDREYERYCLINFSGCTEDEVNQKYSDQDLGRDLLERINKKIRSYDSNHFMCALCCSPRRTSGNLKFWINTGRSTQIDGWKTQEQIEDYLKSDGKLIDTMIS